MNQKLVYGIAGGIGFGLGWVGRGLFDRKKFDALNQRIEALEKGSQPAPAKAVAA